MTTAAIREKLHEYINFADDKKVKAIYTMVEEEIIERLDLWEDQAFVKELDKRMADLESGKIKCSTLEEITSKY